MSGGAVIYGWSSFLSMSVSSFVSMLLLDFLSGSSLISCYVSRIIELDDVSLCFAMILVSVGASSFGFSSSLLPNVNDFPLSDYSAAPLYYFRGWSSYFSIIIFFDYMFFSFSLGLSLAARICSARRMLSSITS